MSVTSGFNALAHAVGEPYTENPNPFVALMTEEGIRMLPLVPSESFKPRK